MGADWSVTGRAEGLDIDRVRTRAPLILARSLGALVAVGVTLNLAATVFGVGDQGYDNKLAEVTYQLLVAGAAVATLLRVVVIPRQRMAWLLVGIGMTAWSAGELGWVGPESGVWDSTWASHAAFLIFYVGVLAGIRELARHTGEDLTLSLGFFVGFLGVATLWAGVFFGPGNGESFELAADFAYPFLDLIVLALLFGVWAVHGRPRDPSMVAFLAAFVIIGVADTLYAVHVHADTLPLTWTLMDSLWPIGGVLIATAAWLDRGQHRARVVDFSREWLSLALSVAAGTFAVAVLVWDHYDRIGEAAVAIATLTVLVAFIHMVLLQGRWSLARGRGTRAAALSAEALATIVEMQSRRSAESVQRRARIAAALGPELGFGSRRADDLVVAARLGNVGQLSGVGQSTAGRTPANGSAGPETTRAAELLDAIGLEQLAVHIRDQDARWDERTNRGTKSDGISAESSALGVIAQLDRLMTADGELGFADACSLVAAERGRRFAPEVIDALLRAAQAHDPALGELAHQ